jgi:deazaflavin-dependent oxidoreductase (nitroreductase family)
VPVDPARSRMPSWLPRFNLIVTNRVQGLWAPYLPPYAMILHTGRRSGRSYRTPVLAFRRGNRLAVALPYGSGAQWIRNVLAAGGAEAIRGGRRLRLSQPRIVTEDAGGELPRVAAWMSRRMGVLVCDVS